MKDLFNNRWFIGVLGVCSVLLLAGSIAAPYLDQPDFSDAPPIHDPLADDVEEPSYEKAASAAEGKPPIDTDLFNTRRQGVLNGDLTWNTEYRRDPFSGRADIPTSDDPAPSNQPSISVQSAAPSVLPKLDALVVGPDSLLAVLGDEIVREGDHVGDLLVTRIDRHGVELEDAYRSFWIPFSDTSSSAMTAQLAERDR